MHTIKVYGAGLCAGAILIIFLSIFIHLWPLESDLDLLKQVEISQIESWNYLRK